MAFNAKNLHYERQEPAFLRRLRSENTSDRHNVSFARPRKPRLEDGDDDKPTIVDEQGENLTEKEYQDLLHGTTEDATVSKDVSTAAKPDPESENQRALPDGTDDMNIEREKRHFAISNFPKKRKQVKAIGAETEPEPECSKVECDSSDAKRDDESETKRRKKKKIKLSFDDPET